ncbi:MAG: hypothetical protein M3358_12645 [Actinomycetota bacterium]|nr:hypothetical protein [Actinomycetota bacterium]
MHPRRPSTTLFLAGVILFAGLLVGCGGGGQSANGAQDGESGGTKQQGGEAAKKEGNQAVKKARPRARIALGTVRSVNPESRELTLEPSAPAQGKGPIPFKIAKNATVTLDDKETELAQAGEGQQAQITYIVKNEVNVARQVALISGG